MTTYHIAIRHLDHDELWVSESYELDKPGHKKLIDDVSLCVAGRSILSFSDSDGNVIVFPFEVLSRCVVRLVKEGEEDE